MGVGLWVRLKLTETPAFAESLKAAPPPKVPLAELLTGYWRAVLGGTLAAIACFAIFYLATAFALGFGTTKLGIPRETFLSVQLFAILFLALGIFVSGAAADRFGADKVLMAGCGLTMMVASLLVPTLGSGQLMLIALFLATALFAMGLVYGPLGAWLPSLFPARVRYSGASVAFNMAGILGGGLAPLVAQRLSDQYGLGAVGLYLALCAGLSLIGLLALRAKA